VEGVGVKVAIVRALLRDGPIVAIALLLGWALVRYVQMHHDLAMAQSRAESAERSVEAAREETAVALATLAAEGRAREAGAALDTATTTRKAVESRIKRRAGEAATLRSGGRAPSDVEVSAEIMDRERAAGMVPR
jgi:uncharacterized protein with beta-barrel porin domain